MTTQAALNKARKILGPRAAVCDQKRVTEFNGKKLNDRFRIGKITMGFYSIFATGMSWEDAFEALERRRQRNPHFI